MYEPRENNTIGSSKISLSKKYPNTEIFLVRIFPYSVQIRKNTDQKKLHIRTIFASPILFGAFLIQFPNLSSIKFGRYEKTTGKFFFLSKNPGFF